MSAPLVNRSLATLKTELEFLRDSEVITDGLYNQIVEKLPNRYQAGAPPIDVIGATGSSQQSTPAVATPIEKNNALVVPQPTNGSDNNAEYVEAIYDYKPQQPEDLELRVGDRVQVLEHTSPDWWRGSIGSRSGMFPSNYVKQADDRKQAPSPAPSYRSSLQPQPTNNSQYQQPPPPHFMYQQQQPYQGSSQVQFPPYQGSPYQQQPVQYQQQEVVQQQQGTGHSGQFKKFGSKLGNAAIFGAGATIGSDIVNSIF